MVIGADVLVYVLVYVVIGLLSVCYAFVLQWAERAHHFVSDWTWATVVAGVALTLGPLAVIVPPAEMAKVAGAFVAAGLFQIVRSLYNQAGRQRVAQRAALEEIRGDSPQAVAPGRARREE